MIRCILLLAAMAGCVGGDDTAEDTVQDFLDHPYDPAVYSALCPAGELEAESDAQRAFRLSFFDALNALRETGGSCTTSAGDTEAFDPTFDVKLDPDLTAVMDCFLETPTSEWNEHPPPEIARAMGLPAPGNYTWVALSNHGTIDTDPAEILASIQATRLEYYACESALHGPYYRRAGVAFEGTFIYLLSAI